MKQFLKSIVAITIGVVSFLSVSCDNNTDNDSGTPQPPQESPDYEWYYRVDGGDKVELKTLLMEQNGDMLAILLLPTEWSAGVDEFLASKPDEAEYLSITMPLYAIDQTIDLIESSDVSLSAYAKCLTGVVGLNVDGADLGVTAGELEVKDNCDGSFDISLDITIDGAVRLEAYGVAEVVIEELPDEPQLPGDHPDVESVIKFKWNNKTTTKNLSSAFIEETDEGVIYTLCVDIAKTYVVYEDSIFLRLEVADKGMWDSFEVDIATTTERFSLSLSDPIRGLNFQADNSNRDNCTGWLKVDDGAITFEMSYDSPSGEADDIVASASYGGKYRWINECIDVENNERTLLFTPRSVLLDNSDPEVYKVYVSSRAGVTTVKGMANAEVIVSYPASGWDTLLKGNFVSGSTHAMSFTLDGTTYIKGEGVAVGMNCQFIEYDAAAKTLILNTNLYTQQGGVAIYYSGPFALVE